METKKSKPHNFGREVTIKGLIVIGMIIFLLIPIFILQGKIWEREQRRDEAVNKISEGWSRSQTVDGPLLSLPYVETVTDKKGNVELIDRILRMVPERLDIKTILVPEERKYGMFQAIVYTADITICGEFNPLAPEDAPSKIPEISRAWVGLRFSDLRGLSGDLVFYLDGKPYPVDHTFVDDDGIIFRIPDYDITTSHNFSCKILLKGSGSVNFIPIGQTTDVEVTGSWPDPSFVGNFLPIHDITDSGFTAKWSVLSFNRSIPAMWTGEKSAYSRYETTFGVNLVTGADEYQQNERAVKYALLFVVLTFVVFFFVEILTYKRIHPIQYLLVGAALMIFYTLLLSISEVTGFGWAYLISALSTVGLITLYTASIFKDRKETMLLSFILSGLYAYLYFILQMENYTLLVGSVGLFVILAVIMFVSRKVSWYRTDETRNMD